MFADVIFPVFTAPYFIVFGLPWAILLALLAEIVIYRIKVRGPNWWAVSSLTVGANIFSWFVGACIAARLPLGYATGAVDATGRFWFPGYAVFGAFVIAWLLSVVLEGVIWKIVLRKHPELPLWRATALANAASYAFLLGVLFVCNHFSLRLEM